MKDPELMSFEMNVPIHVDQDIQGEFNSEPFLMTDEFGLNEYHDLDKTYPLVGCLIILSSATFTLFMVIKIYKWLFL